MLQRSTAKKLGIYLVIILVLTVVMLAFLHKFTSTTTDEYIIEKKSENIATQDPSLNSDTNSMQTPALNSETNTAQVPTLDSETNTAQVSMSDSETKTAQVLASDIEANSSVSILAERLKSPNAVLIGLEDDTIRMQKNAEEIIYPASLTKMMTAIVAIENLPDLNKEIKLDNSMFQGLYEANASMAGFKPGEMVRAIDLLYGVLLPSGAEACIGLAMETAGSEFDFVERMNQKAADLGMINTHYENTTGLHDENHYTTVKDQAILLSYALQNDTFREVFTSPSHSTQPTNKNPYGITFSSTMFKKLNDQNIMDGEILGGKTGYTDEAGLCLASLAQVGNEEYILITAGAKGDHYSEQYNITDALAVYNSIAK